MKEGSFKERGRNMLEPLIASLTAHWRLEMVNSDDAVRMKEEKEEIEKPPALV